MLSEAKNTSEMMVDLAFAAVYFGDHEMAEEVRELETRMNDLVHDMRAVCILAVRNPQDAEAMASVLQVIGAIERIADDAADITRIVTHRLGIPRELVADLAMAEEVSHRVVIRSDSEMAHRQLSELALPTATGFNVIAIRRGTDWIVEVDGQTTLLPGDVIYLEGPREGIDRLRQLAGAPEWQPPVVEDVMFTDLDRAVDTIVEMKNLSEVALGLAYSTLVLRDPGLAAEVQHLEDRLDEMRDRLELWVLRAGGQEIDPSPLRGLLHLSNALEDIGDAARQMVWIIEEDEDVHPILSIALGESDEVVMRVPVMGGSKAEGRSLGELKLAVEPGYHVLAVKRAGRYSFVRPRSRIVLREGDQILATGPDEGREALARIFGWRLAVDEDSGEMSLLPLAEAEGVDSPGEPELSESAVTR
ncbi:MAG: potassium channel protein [Acidimicrobiales bacterium]|nr:MAG: potassium channel protein [Acidimicrobiales bacterium]